MNKKSLKIGLILAVFVSILSIQQTVSAFSLTDLLKKDDQPIKQETVGEVLSSNTENPSNQPEKKEEASNEREERIVEVIKGDSLNKIAKAHNVSYKRIFDANETITDPNIINPGQKIRIPYEDEELISRPLPEPVKVATPTKKTSRPVSSRTQEAQQPATVSSGSVWDSLAQCESGGRWNLSTGNGYYGGLQFSAGTWRAVGGTGLPHQHSREEQIKRAEILLAKSGWGQWPSCTKKLGLR